MFEPAHPSSGTGRVRVCVAKVVSTVGTSLVLITVVVMGRALNSTL